MFKVTYKDGWSPTYVVLGTYATREDATRAVRENLKGSKPKVWSIRIEAEDNICQYVGAFIPARAR